MAYPLFSPPREVRILSVVQILFVHPQSQSHAMCKVDIDRLNRKLQKLQKEGMVIVGIFFTDVEKEAANVAKLLQKGGAHG